MADHYSRANIIRNIVNQQEGNFDPFMLKFHVLTRDQEYGWNMLMFEAFARFVNQMSQKEFLELQEYTLKKYPETKK